MRRPEIPVEGNALNRMRSSMDHLLSYYFARSPSDAEELRPTMNCSCCFGRSTVVQIILWIIVPTDFSSDSPSGSALTNFLASESFGKCCGTEWTESNPVGHAGSRSVIGSFGNLLESENESASCSLWVEKSRSSAVITGLIPSIIGPRVTQIFGASAFG